MRRETFDLSSLQQKISEIQDTNKGNQEIDPEIRSSLEKLQKAKNELSANLRKEMHSLEKSFHEKAKTIFSERSSIINGSDASSPTIPSFWLQALMNHPSIGSIITEEDSKALAFLRDIELAYNDTDAGFCLNFVFNPNPYFENEVLTKTYYLSFPDPEVSDACEELEYDHAKGTEIEWKEGNNLCYKILIRTQRNKNNGSTRTIKRVEPVDSFFHFFAPPSYVSMSEEEADDEKLAELEDSIRLDFEMGECIKDQIIPNALAWYTGEALQYADFDEEDYSDEDGDSYEDEDEEDDDDERDGSDDERETNTAQKPECKQQ